MKGVISFYDAVGNRAVDEAAKKGADIVEMEYSIADQIDCTDSHTFALYDRVVAVGK